MDDETISVSKGVFVFSNEFKPSSKREKGNKRQSFSQNVSFKNSLFSSNLWYRSYSTLWRSIEDEIEYLNNTMFERVLEKLVGFVKTCHYNESEEIPTAVLLTGINMPDHAVQFTAFSKQLKDTVTPHVACLYSQDAQNIKYLMENMINQFINETNDCLFEEFAVAEHFSYGNAMALCSMDKRVTTEVIDSFSHDDLENVRHLLSFRKLVEGESYENRIKILTDDDYFKQILRDEIKKLQKYIRRFHMFLYILCVLVRDLPKAPLGIQVRDLYAIATTKKITKTQEYKECFKLLGFQSKGELSSKLNTIISYLERKISGNTKNKIRELSDKLKMHLNNMNDFTMEEMEEAVNEIESSNRMDLGSFDRRQFKEKLIGMSKVQNKPLNRYGKYRENILEILSVSFEDYLVEPKSFHFHEIFFFDDISIQNHIVGCHRSAIHSALNDPQYYLQCDCCEIPFPSSIRPSMPDISIVYKLHLECGKMINLYDWLQAFVSIIDGKEDDEGKMLVDLNIQARFTQCVAELEYLGFIKTTKRKADHVSRLTWGG
ncbi:origin recognition complex subunit 3 isoform X3 [Leptinotarsa decemlineata]|uniref:origin recognition complex subunit 3 isoform X3 n=1 Tax=Leptinotarsa decemlineata TaxID=7539 RepID=UPI003D30A005